MTVQTYEAVFEKGTFKLVEPDQIQLAEGQKVRLVVEEVKAANEVLAMATAVYEGLTAQEISDLEEIILKRDDFFKPSQATEEL